MMKVAVVLVVLLSMVCLAAGQGEEQMFKQVLKDAAAKAKAASPENRAKLQEMLKAHAAEHHIDLRGILTPEEYDSIFGDPQDEIEEEEEEEEYYDPELEALKEKITNFLSRTKPKLLKKLPALYKRYAGREQELYDDLVKKHSK
eukprot:TRINITY_DN1625_c0_g4_i1.p1 TRINITY_DN1625_c0_g4~~TRINITY_DN1625_c0_g4_i1.p1  ORF type:complete len:145 (+),score=57.61 TRINITY_DN1625_c0_g4_i1:43-477(+)